MKKQILTMGGGGFTSKLVLYLRQVEMMRVIKNVFILHIKSLIVKRAIYLYLVRLKVT